MKPRQAVLLIIVFLFVPLFLPALRHSLPTGYGALYALMAEEVVAHNFALPWFIPVYGPGGLPFAYPPLAFYIMAAVTESTGCSPIDYLRFAPPCLLLASAVVLFLFASSLTRHTVHALLTAILYATSAVVLNYHNETSGVCRGVALLNALLALLFFQRFLGGSRRRDLLLTVFFFGLTVLSHPSYLVFLALSVCVLVTQARSRLWTVPFIVLAGFTLTLPWWGLVVWRHGIGVFAHALGTHGTLSFLDGFTDGSALAALLTSIVPGPTTGPRFWLTIVGLAVAVANRDWLLPAWLLLTGLVTGPEGDRFRILPASFLSARALCWAGEQLARRTNHSLLKEFGNLGFLSLVLLSIYLSALHRSAATRPRINDDLVAAAHWVKENTPQQARFLLFSSDSSQQEMLPYFARRPAAAGTFGAEWTGRWAAEAKLMGELNECINGQSFACAEARLRAADVTIETLVLPEGGGQRAVDAELAIHPHWTRAYAAGRYSVWRRVSDGSARATHAVGE